MSLRARCIPLVAVIAGCDSDLSPLDPSPVPKEPISLRWSEQELKGLPHGHIAVAAEPEGIRIHTAAVDGVKYEIGGRTGYLGGSTSIELEHPRTLGETRYENLDRIDTQLALTLTFPDGRQATTPLPPISYENAIDGFFARIDRNPIPFHGEPRDPQPADSLFVVDDDIGFGGIVGREGALQDIDFVVRRRALATTSVTKCMYKSSDHAYPEEVTIRRKPMELTIRDRRTSGLVATKVFEAPAECPFVITTGLVADSSVKPKTVDTWLTSWLEARQRSKPTKRASKAARRR